MKHKCPACNRTAVEAVVMVDNTADWDANDTIYECQWCHVVISLVVWDVYEDRIHIGLNCVSPEDIGCTIILHMARNLEAACDWTNLVQPGFKADTQMNPN
jgi:hypothetical protein